MLALHIQVNRQYRSSEPEGIDPERSVIWQMVLTDLWKEGLSRSHIAKELLIPDSELESLLFGLVGSALPPSRQAPALRSVE